MDISLREPKMHGTLKYTLQMYRIYSSTILVTNHWHNEAEIIYIRTGTLSISIGGKNFLGKSGDVFVVNSFELHEMHACGAVEYYAFVFDWEMLSFDREDYAQAEFIAPLKMGEIVLGSYFRGDKFEISLFEEAVRLNEEMPAGYMLMTKGILLLIAGRMIEKGYFGRKKQTCAEREREKSKKRIIAYADEKFSEKIALEKIARELNMSRQYFCRFFKEIFGKTFVEYMNEVRTEKAMKLLAGGANVTETALSCGFSNMSYFTRTFKKITGQTPSEYKKNI